MSKLTAYIFQKTKKTKKIIWLYKSPVAVFTRYYNYLNITIANLI